MVQVLIAAAMSGVIALGLVKIQENAQKSQNTVMKNFESMQIITQAEQALRNKLSCEATIADSAGGQIRNHPSQIIRATSLGKRPILEVGKEYTGMGQSGKVTIADMHFDINAINPATDIVDISPDPPGQDLVAVTVDFIITLDKSATGLKEEVAGGYGAKTIDRRLPGFTFVVDVSGSGGDVTSGTVTSCYSRNDEYVEAACSALGGTINTSTGKCDDIQIDNLRVNSLVAEDEIVLDQCMRLYSDSVSTGGGASVTGANYRTIGACKSNYLHGSGGAPPANIPSDAVRGAFNVEYNLLVNEGVVGLGSGGSSSGGGISTNSAPRAGGIAAPADGMLIVSSGAGPMNLDANLEIRLKTRDANGKVIAERSMDIGTDASNILTVNGVSNFNQSITANGVATFNQTVTANGVVTFNQNVTLNAELNSSEDLTTSGSMHATSFETTSDERLKENIEKLDDSVSKITKLNGYKFNWIDRELRGDRKHLGLIAQEVLKEFPELVRETTSGILRVDYMGMVAPLIEALKQQQSQIKKQQLELNKLNSELSEIKEFIKKSNKSR